MIHVLSSLQQQQPLVVVSTKTLKKSPIDSVQSLRIRCESNSINTLKNQKNQKKKKKKSSNASAESESDSVAPCRLLCSWCGRRHFIGIGSLGASSLLPIFPSNASDLESNSKVMLNEVHPPRADWYEEFYALAMEKSMRAYEEEIAGYKEELFSNLRGKRKKVLEIGIGTGPNLKYYAGGGDTGVHVIGVDPNRKMEKYAQAAATAAGLPLSQFYFAQAVGEALPVDDASVDAVIGTLVLCTVKDVKMTLEVEIEGGGDSNSNSSSTARVFTRIADSVALATASLSNLRTLISGYYTSNKNNRKAVPVGLTTKHYTVDYRFKVATLQFCFGTSCVILQLNHFDTMPDSLISFLADPMIVFVGKGIRDCVYDLKRDYALECKNVIELGPLADRVLKGHKYHNYDLVKLATEIVGLDTMASRLRNAKAGSGGRGVRMSSWEVRDLNSKDIEIGTLEAFASYLIGNKLLTYARGGN